MLAGVDAASAAATLFSTFQLQAAHSSKRTFKDRAGYLSECFDLMPILILFGN